MSGSNRKRKSGAAKASKGGHPARIARERAEREARAQSQGAKPRGDAHAHDPAQDAPADPVRELAHALDHAMTQVSSTLDAEIVVSELLGRSWPPSPDQAMARVEPEVEVYSPIAAELEEIGSPGALAALLTIAAVSQSDLAAKARVRARRLTEQGVEPPSWTGSLGDTKVERAVALREDVFDDGSTIFLEARGGGDGVHAIGIYIDHNLGGMATDIVPADSIDVVRSAAENDEGPHATRVEQIDPAEAAARLRRAMRLTDRTFEAPVSDHYSALRSLALARAGQAPEATVEAAPEVSQDEQDRLRDEFLASEEATGLARDVEGAPAEGTPADRAPGAAGAPAGDAPADRAPAAAPADDAPRYDVAPVVSTAIAFASSYTLGGPLRWSPDAVELFLADWRPRNLDVEPENHDAFCRTLKAWLRFVGRKREMPQWAIDENLGAVDQWSRETLDADGE